MLKIGIAQICSKADCSYNLRLCTAVARRAALAGAEMVFYPECADIVFSEEYDTEGERRDPVNIRGFLEGMKGVAKELGLWIVLGAHTEDPNDPSKWLNSALTYSPTGTLTHKYDKLHPCVVHMGSEMDIDERAACTSGSADQGNGLLPLEVISKSGEVWKIGVSICYDLRYAPLAAYHRNQGCHAIAYLTAWFPYTRTHWDPLITVRAIDNQAYIIAPGQYGQHNPERSSLGASAIVSPWGSKLVSLPAIAHDVPARGDGETTLATGKEEAAITGPGGSWEKLEEWEGCWIGYGELEMEEVEKLREGIPMAEFWREDVYGGRR